MHVVRGGAGQEHGGAGVVACGLGSNLISKALLEARDYAGITKRVRETVELVRQVRESL